MLLCFNCRLHWSRPCHDDLSQSSSLNPFPSTINTPNTTNHTPTSRFPIRFGVTSLNSTIILTITLNEPMMIKAIPYLFKRPLVFNARVITPSHGVHSCNTSLNTSTGPEYYSVLIGIKKHHHFSGSHLTLRETSNIFIVVFQPRRSLRRLQRLVQRSERPHIGFLFSLSRSTILASRLLLVSSALASK